MNTKALKTLEFDKILKLLSDCATSAKGKEKCLRLVPQTDPQRIKELLKMAQELKANAEQASELGLTEEEQAFYDALTKPQAVRDFYENSQLVAMAKELTEALRSSKTIDWRQKESARAKMRSMVKRLLKKYKYPPEEQEAALETVIRQCELYADSDDEN